MKETKMEILRKELVKNNIQYSECGEALFLEDIHNIEVTLASPYYRIIDNLFEGDDRIKFFKNSTEVIEYLKNYLLLNNKNKS